VFGQEGTYDVQVKYQRNASDQRFLVAIGKKSAQQLYAHYHYTLGFDARLQDIAQILSNCTQTQDYVHDLDTLEVIRREGFMMDLFERDRPKFQHLMQMLRELVQRVLPAHSVIYLKDKLNQNPREWKFPLHQDASSGWNNKMRKHFDNPNFVTVGIPLAAVTNPEQGPTRIAIRQGYAGQIVRETTAQHSVDAQAYEEHLGKPLQYLLCVGQPGSYYLFDQYVLHDSAYNLQQQSRNVWFVTLALSEEPDDVRSESIDIAREFYQTKGALDKRAIEQLLRSGIPKERLVRDAFGKFSL
jgi:ectoine hydroxylase-related dioxygenase (phytanoyl-CoA dioxygenase family)